jgi:hypothetical protein
MKKSEFERIAMKAFRSLESRYGFKKGEATYSQKDCALQYLNATTDVTLHYELGREPWLVIADITNAENRSTLGWLLVERGVEKMPTPADAFRATPLADGNLESDIEKKIKQLIEHGADLMKGDFSLMPNLQKRAQKYALDCDRFIAIYKTK